MMAQQTSPVLLFNDECGVCQTIAGWVHRSAQHAAGGPSIIERPIGDDPDALLALNPKLDIWDAYKTIHLLMPDGSMKLGGEAVAEVLRRLPNTKWFAWSFAVGILGFRPFQVLLNLGYAILADVRPIFGCESCGTPSLWLRPIRATVKWLQRVLGKGQPRHPSPHFARRVAIARRATAAWPVVVEPADRDAVAAWRNEGDPN